MDIQAILDKADMFRDGLAWVIIIAVLFNLFLFTHFIYKKIRIGNQESKHLRFLRYLRLGFFFSFVGALIVNLALLFTGVGLAAGLIIPQPKVVYPSSPSLEATEITAKNPFRITFDRPIDSGILEKSISPELEGKWSFSSKSYPLLSDTLVFTPSESPAPEARYTIALKNIKSIGGKKKSNYLLSFMSPPLPTVKSVTPPNGTQNVLIGQKITVETDFPHDDSARLDFKLKPDIAVEVTKANQTKYILTPKEGLKKSTTYTLDVYRTPVSRNFKDGSLKETGESDLISQSTFRTLEAPGVADYGPKGSGVLIDSSVWIDFKQNMDRASTESAFSISPTVAGVKSWESDRKLVFKPQRLNKNTSYRITVAKGAKVSDGTPLEEAFSFSFVTIGHVVVSSFSPSNNSSGIDLSAPISVRFNQAVDHASAQGLFSINPSIQGSFTWSGNTMIYSHSSFGYSTRYTVTVASGVKTVYGLDSSQAFSAAFTTRHQSVMLQVPSYRQVHMYSCMAAAARSALAYKGARVGEDYLLSLIGYDPTPFQGTWRNSNSTWGNPYSGIVGNINGPSGGVSWGYGAYWGPTANAIAHYRPAEVKTGWNVSGIASEISKGNPVLIWWVNGVWPAYEVYWKTTGGQSIRGVNSMHVQVVKGFTGSVSNPTSFTVTDSGYGYPARTFDIKTFKAKWSWFGNSAVVVR